MNIFWALHCNTHKVKYINVIENLRGNPEWTIKNGQSRMSNPVTLTTLGTQDEDKQNKQNQNQHRKRKG